MHLHNRFFFCNKQRLRRSYKYYVFNRISIAKLHLFNSHKTNSFIFKVRIADDQYFSNGFQPVENKTAL